MEKDDILAAYKKVGGRIETKAKVKLTTKEDFALFYTPGVGKVSMHLAEHPEEVKEYSVKKNSVAVISDGSAVLGLGNIGPYGALPVMEGKALIFKELGNVDAWPIVLSTQDPDEIVRTITAIAPSFGGINLEDFKAPECFEIERRLIEALDIPVMHDDQHGTAIIVLAGLINAAKVVGKNVKELKVVIVGAGAAGAATAKLLHAYGVNDIIVTDRTGLISKGRTDLTGVKQQLLDLTNPRNIEGQLEDALNGADAVIGLSGAGRMNGEHIKMMAPNAIVFAMANPTPEIMPDEAKAAGAAVIGTGRSDFPNQINNALVFPGVFRGALDSGVRKITQDMKLAAALAIAALVPEPTAERIVPDILETSVVEAVARAIR
ncbi:MAG: malate dehydrogenase (oxaloacetate-decarboxylating) [Parcubacteria bacterium C7867-001]|nr:MAG: malate dehydrogenase (oxaloacetate-decarboxylating) [Parcubacteria bacterium C7867-001]